jgi:uncharacterized protein (TIGR02266 family)
MARPDKKSVKRALRGMLRRLSRPSEAEAGVPDEVEEDPANQRDGSRVPICLEIDMAFEDGTQVRNKTLDVSRGGAFVRTPNTRPPGTPVQVDMRIGSQRISLDAVVAHVVEQGDGQSRTPGIGVEFDSVDEETDDMLDKLLSKYKKVAR